MAQTAVEWLVEQLETKKYQKAYGDTYISVDLMAKAKQIEKEQIKEAYNMGTWNKDEKYKNSKEYYNKTYNK